MAFLNETGLEQVWGKIKTKVNTIENTIDDINEAKVDKVSGKGLSTNDFTTDEKNKLAGIATGATKVIVDNALSNTSTNAIQNKVVANMKSDIDDALSAKLDTITTSGDGNIITDISKSGTTINAKKNAFATTVKEGNPVSEVGAAGAGFSVKTTFEPIQSGSGDPSPSNIRTISGWTGAKLTRCGKNLLPYFTAETKNGLTLSVASDGTITLNGTPSAQTNFITVLPTPLPVGKYTMSISSNTINGYVEVWLENTDDWGTIGDASSGTLNNSKTFETTKVYHRAKLAVFTDAGTLSNLQLKIQLEKGSTATAYEPYTGDTCAASFGQTVYGGTLDWQTGVLTVDRAIYTMTGEETTIVTYDGWNAGAYRVYFEASNVLYPPSEYVKYDGLICSHTVSEAVGYVAGVSGVFGVGLSKGNDYNGAITIRLDAAHTSEESFRAYLAAQYAAGTPVQVVYKLATPTTIQLTPQDLRMLDGTNNVYSDGNTNYVIFNSGASSLAQVDKNYLKLTGGTLSGYLTLQNNPVYPRLLFKSSSYNNTQGELFYYMPDNAANSYFHFRQYSRSSADYSVLSFYENFQLPTTNADRTSNGFYNILTTKSAVTISQGGTGATSASGARTNLEVPSKTGEGAGGTWQINIGGTATSISSATPTLSTGIENNAITVKTNDNGSLGSNNLAIRSALDFRWYDTNWQVGNLRGGSTNSEGFGFSYSNDGGSTYALKSYIDTNGNYVGNASTTTKLKNCYSSRQTSANLTADGSGGIINFKATNSMTTGKPVSDGHILHMYWDNTGGWDSQFYIPNSNYAPQYRFQSSGTWGSWINFLTENNYINYTVTKTGGGASGTWEISITGGAAAAIQDGSGNVISSTYCKLSGGNPMTPPANGDFAASSSSGAWFYDSGFGLCSIGRGNGDGASLGASGKANLFIKSWYGVGFVSTQANTGVAVAINCRTGEVLANNFTGSGASLTSLNASNITSGTLAIAYGGTGSTSKSGARTNLGIVSGTSLPSASGYAAGDIFILY